MMKRVCLIIIMLCSAATRLYAVSVSTLTVSNGYDAIGGDSLVNLGYDTKLNTEDSLEDVYVDAGKAVAGHKWLGVFFDSITFQAASSIASVEVRFRCKMQAGATGYIYCDASGSRDTTLWSDSTVDNETGYDADISTREVPGNWAWESWDVSSIIETAGDINNLELLFRLDDGATGKAYLDCVQVIVACNEHTYDFTVNESTTRWGYSKVNEDFRPPSSGPVLFGESEFGSYSAVYNSDDNRLASTSLFLSYPEHHFKFTIAEATYTVENIHIEWEGYGIDSDSVSGAYLYVYNFGSFAWETAGTHTSDSDAVIEKDLSKNVNRYINEGKLHVIAVGPNSSTGVGTAAIKTDYIKVVIKTEDEIPPSGITVFNAITGEADGEIELSWISPGDDGTLKWLRPGSEFRIQYSTFSVQWSTADYNVSIATSSVYPHDTGYHTVTGLAANTTYYYRIWAGDDVLNWSGLSAGATAVTRAVVPGNPWYSATSSDSLVVSWPAGGNPQGTAYLVELATVPAFSTILSSSALSALEYEFDSLLPDNTYYARVKAKNYNSLETGYTGISSTHTLCNVPGMPVFDTFGPSSIGLSWTAGGNPGYSVYELESSTDNTQWSTIISTISLEYSDNALPGNTTYYYRLRALNLDGIYSNYSTVNSTATLAQPPAGITHSANSTVSMEWSWESGGGEMDFYAYTLVPSSASGWATGTNFLQSGLSVNTEYTLYVKARNWNSIETVAVSTSAYTSIETPAGILFGDITKNGISVKAAGSFSNIVSGSSGLILENLTAGTTSGWKQDNDYWAGAALSPNTTYQFRARARNGDGEETPYCNLLATSTLCDVPGLPALVGVWSSSASIKINTAANPAGTNYSIKVSTPGGQGFLQADNTIGDTAVYRSTVSWTSEVYVRGLLSNTTYGFRVNAVNNNGIVTTYSVMLETVTLADLPSNVIHSTNTLSSISWAWESGGSEESFYAYMVSLSTFTGWSGDLPQFIVPHPEWRIHTYFA